MTHDDDIALELERSADRAKSRGGPLAASALLERAALLTSDAALRADRMLAAAAAKRDAGDLDAALRLLPAVQAETPSDTRSALTELLHGQITFDQHRGADAARLLRGAAVRLESLDPPLSRETYLEALAAAIWESGVDNQDGLMDVAKAARAAPAARVPRVIDLLLDALAVRLTEGFEAAASKLAQALAAAIRALDVEPKDVDRRLWLVGNRTAGIVALEVWDYDAGRAVFERLVHVARVTGALVQLQFALNFLSSTLVISGELDAASALIEEDRLVSKMTGFPPIAVTSLHLEAFRGNAERTSTLFATIADSLAGVGQGRVLAFANYTAAVLHNGLGRHERALECVHRVFDGEVLGGQTLAVPEFAEAASRTGNVVLLGKAREWMSHQARVCPTAWARGIDARVQALASSGTVAEALYRESIAQLGTTNLRVDLARGHLLYGEWLRREGRRSDARKQLHTAHEMFVAMDLSAFAERARREVLATGEKIRKRTAAATGWLTAQEAQIARLVQQGLSNPEIATRLFLSDRTVEWHLRNVFGKVGVSSRRQLRDIDLEVRVMEPPA